MSTPKPSEEVRFKTSIAMTIIASLSKLMWPRSQLTLEVFLGKWFVFRTESAFYPWSAVFSLHFTLSLLFTPLPPPPFEVCSLHSTLTDINKKN